MTKQQLAASLFSSATNPVNVTIKGVTGKVISMANEDGSGSSFNVVVQVGSRRLATHVRTID